MSYTQFTSDDIIEGNIVRGVTSTAFSNNSGSLTAFHASAAGLFQWECYNKATSNTDAEVQFSIAYGRHKGSGSVGETGASTGFTPTRAIYSQFRQILLTETDPSTTFGMEDNTNHGRMYFLTMNRARYKQGINTGNWELHLSSSNGAANKFASGSALKLIDDSTLQNGETVNGHLVYNIVSGSESSGVYKSGSANEIHYWGKIYPELGIMAFAGNKILLHAGPGGDNSGLQLGVEDSDDTYDEMNGRFFDAINRGKYFAIRASEDVTSTHYFVRAKNSHFNYSTNPTYQTGSTGQLAHNSFIQNPQTFITTVGMYNDNNELLATAKLSKPMLKNFERETTIRVKLDY